MKHSLDSKTVQMWGLLDLKPMHRALLRRSVEPIGNQGLHWQVASWRENDQALLEMMSRQSVLIVDRNGLIQRTLEARSKDEAPPAFVAAGRLERGQALRPASAPAVS